MPQWYYAKDDEQHGPISESELQAMVTAGTVTAGDEVWREGMADWQPAGQVAELFGERPVVPPPMPGAARRTGGFNLAGGLALLDFNIFQHARPLGPWLLLGGFLMVIGARGCDAVSQRYADRVRSQAALATDEFNYEYDVRKARLELERDEISAKPELTDYDQQRLEKIDESLVELQESRDAEERRLRRTTWTRLQHEASSADENRLQAALWYTIAFVAGSMVLALGLLIVGLTGSGAHSWLCLGMLAIITFSLFIFGATWSG